MSSRRFDTSKLYGKMSSGSQRMEYLKTAGAGMNGYPTGLGAGSSPKNTRNEPSPPEPQMKTRLCRHHIRGMCEWGNNCNFAHTSDELTVFHGEMDKTKVCQSIINGQQCLFEDRCKFAHSIEELRFTKADYKVVPCVAFNRGDCRAGDQCRKAHGNVELSMHRLVVQRQRQGMEDEKNSSFAGTASTVSSLRNIVAQRERELEVEEEDDDESVYSDNWESMAADMKAILTLHEDEEEEV